MKKQFFVNGCKYDVYDDGRIFSYFINDFMKPFKNNSGYLQIKLGGKNYYIHDIIAAQFIGKKPEGYEVDHINNEITDNRVENLRYLTPKENKMKKRAYRSNIVDCHKKVRCIETGEIYIDSKTAAKQMFDNRDAARNIRKICSGEYGYRSYKGFTFEFVEEAE